MQSSSLQYHTVEHTGTTQTLVASACRGTSSIVTDTRDGDGGAATAPARIPGYIRNALEATFLTAQHQESAPASRGGGAAHACLAGEESSKMGDVTHPDVSPRTKEGRGEGGGGRGGGDGAGGEEQEALFAAGGARHLSTVFKEPSSARRV